MAMINFHTYEKSIDQRIEEIVEFFLGYFFFFFSDIYKIIDPYLDPLLHLQEPIEKNILEENIWTLFISMMDDFKLEIRLITCELTKYVKNPTYSHPIKFPINTASNLSVYICRFKNGEYKNIHLHDRWILKKSHNDELSGLHIGPSLTDLRNKDVTVTFFSDKIIKDVCNRFDELWNVCLKEKW